MQEFRFRVLVHEPNDLDFIAKVQKTIKKRLDKAKKKQEKEKKKQAKEKRRQKKDEYWSLMQTRIMVWLFEQRNQT